MMRSLLKAMLVLGVATLVLAGLMVGVTWLTDSAHRPPELPSGEHVVEGRAAPGPTEACPIGAPALFAKVTVACWFPRYELLWSEVRGSPTLRIEGTADTREVIVTAPSPSVSWYGGDDDSALRLAEPEARTLVPGDWTADGSCEELRVEVYAIRPGDPLLIEHDPAGNVVSIGRGTRAELAQDRVNPAHDLPVTYIIAWLLAAAGAVITVLAGLALAIAGWSTPLRAPAPSTSSRRHRVEDEDCHRHSPSARR